MVESSDTFATMMTSTLTNSRRNPFSTALVRPGALPFLFPDDVTAASLIERLAENCWRGQIVGPHGSGKTTLLHGLIPFLREHRRVEVLALNSDQRRLPMSRGVRRRWDKGTTVIIDGYEQLSRGQRMGLRMGCRRRGCGLLVTSHADVGLPTIYATTTSCETVQQLVQLLMAGLDSQVILNRVGKIFRASEGNVRETFFQLYDLYESQQRSGPFS